MAFNFVFQALRMIVTILMQAFSLTQKIDSCQVTDQQLLQAIVTDDAEIIERYLQNPRNQNRRISVQGRTFSPIHLASFLGKATFVDLFINSLAPIDMRENGCTPLWIASQNGQLEIVRSLAKAHGDIEFQGKRRASPIYIASFVGHPAVVDFLIQAQADVNLQEADGCSPLYIASQQGYQRIVDSLIKAQADVNLQEAGGCSPLYIASQEGHQLIVDSLIKAQADVNLQEADGCSPLYIASQNGHQKVVLSLIEAKADANLQRNAGSSPIYIAAQNGHLKITKLLIKAQADINLQRKETGESPIYIASQNGHEKVIESLIKAQADVNLRTNKGMSPLYIASQNGHYRIVDALIKANANVNLEEADGCSPLYIASQCGHERVVDFLLNAQADVNQKTKSGSSPICIAARNNHWRVVEKLIQAQADVNLQEANGWSPLYDASLFDHKKVVESLTKAQADLNLQKVNFWSPPYAALQVLKSQTDLGSLEMVPKASGKSSFRGLNDLELSIQLHSALNKSGFLESRAALQSAVSDVLSEILRKRKNYDGVFVAGSYSEGWGNSLLTLDGRTDIDSDIGVLYLIPGRLYHIADQCKCVGERSTGQNQYRNGHILCAGFASNPSLPSSGSSVRPAVDSVSASRLCSYPQLALLHPNRVKYSNIPESVLENLRRDLNSASSPCYVVHAASPGRAGLELRVSTSFLEKRLLRSLNTLQGQLFVTLKYLVKKVVCPAGGSFQGLKSYHAKTIMFRMLDETPAEQWKPENLLNLVRRSLQMLLDCVDSNRTPDNADGRIMEHFFLTDAQLYLKGYDRGILDRIADRLRAEIELLPESLVRFANSLKPVSESGRFYFHPFLILPDLRPMSLPRTSSGLEYYEIYDVVRECVLRLSHGDCGEQSQVSLTELIDRLPDCAFTTREALRVLNCLKFGSQSTAEYILNKCSAHEVSRGIDWPVEKSAAPEATAGYVWWHMSSQDSAWKFCFQFDEQPKFKFLTAAVAETFPMEAGNSFGIFFINFDALMWALRLQLQTEPYGITGRWISDVARREESDAQELLVAILFSKNFEETHSLFVKLTSLSAHSLSAYLWKEIDKKLQHP